MTNREFLSSIVSANISDEITTFAITALANMDDRNAKRRNTPTKEQIENASIKVKMIEFISANPKATAKMIADECEISTQKVSALASQLVSEEKITYDEVAIKGKGKVRGYSIVE